MTELQDRIIDAPVKWVAVVSHVNEVSLLGTADWSYWRDQLQSDDLLPAEHDGKAHIKIISADMKYMGIRFQELSVSVALPPPRQGTMQNAGYLTQAFNSCRFFAFSERVFFSTPYDFGKVRLSTTIPCSIDLRVVNDLVLEAKMDAGASATVRTPSFRGAEVWEGPVFLPGKQPGKQPGKGAPGKYFLGKLQGETRRFPFEPGRDSFQLKPSPRCEILQALLESNFAVQEWIVREDALHAKSKTYRCP